MALTLDGTSGITQMTGSIVMSGSTSGTTTIIPSAVAGTTTVTLPASTGTVMVSGNMPAFSAWQSTGQSLSASTNTKALFQTEEFDTNSNFASSTFTPTVAGYYQVSGGNQPATAASTLTVFVYKNGTVYKNIAVNIASASWVYGSCLVYCNGTTDYIELYFYSAVLNTTNPTQQSTYFQAAMVRSA